MTSKKVFVAGVVMIAMGAFITSRTDIPEGIALGDKTLDMRDLGYGLLLLGGVCIVCTRPFWVVLGKFKGFLDFMHTGSK